MNSVLSSIATMANGWVEFPKLFGDKGLRIPINDIAFKIGSFEVRWYGLIICLAVVLCIVLGLKSCNKHGMTQDDMLDYVLFAIPSAMVGARLYYVIFEWQNYADDPIKALYVWEGGLAVYGGVIAALIALLCVAKYKKHSFIRIAGFAMPYIILGQAIGRWGNFFNQEAFGRYTDLPWGMTGDQISEWVNTQVANEVPGYAVGTLVHPTFLYESLWCFAAFAFMMVYRKKWEKHEGESLCLYMILYGIERTLVEGLRTDSLYIGNTNVRVSQLLSAVLVIAGIALFIDLKRRQKQAAYETSTQEDGEEISGGLESVVEKMQLEEAEERKAREEIKESEEQEENEAQ